MWLSFLKGLESRRGRWQRKHKPRRVRPVLEQLEDRRLLSTFAVENTNLAGPGSLLLAIVQANDNPGLDTINFNIPGSGVQTIVPTVQLPLITDPVIIDGTSQPGYAPGQPVIELDGSHAGSCNGLEFKVPGN